jgi:hypothetical protein
MVRFKIGNGVMLSLAAASVAHGSVAINCDFPLAVQIRSASHRSAAGRATCG